jgi:hypothetical protein
MSRIRATIAAGAIAGSMLLGGVIGATLTGMAAITASAATTPAATASPAAPSGTFKPNEDPTHEAGESAEREAQEDAGQVPTVP